MNKLSYIFSLVLIFVLLAGCTKSDRDKLGVGLPDEAENTVIAYLDATKQGSEKSVEYAYFTDEWIREAYLASSQVTSDYKVESAEKVNDNLYALIVLYKTNYTGDAYLRAYNFVGLIDGRWYYMNGVGNIPENLRENLDEKNYTYTDDGYL